MLQAIDRAVVVWMNDAVGSWPAFDEIVLTVAGNHLLKGGVLMAFVWWAWFCRGGRRLAIERRKTMVATFVGTVAALAVSAAIQHTWPYRPRPIHDPTLALHAPAGLAPDVMANWSSFPSDHATLFFALATGLLFVARPLGIAAWTYVTLVIALPRLYVGWHYPSDIVAGAVLGATAAVIAQRPAVRERVAAPVVAWGRIHPQAFHAAFFLLSYQVATLLDDVRVLAGLTRHLLHGRLV